MKRIISLFLCVVMLCGIAAAAAEGSLPYMEMFENDVPYRRYKVLTQGSYPQVCISPYSEGRLYEWDMPEKPLFAVFPAPTADSYCRAFSVTYATFEDLKGDRRFQYGFRSSYWTFDKFLDKVTEKDLILLDGSGGAAVYLSPEYGQAHALIAVAGIETADKLEITVDIKDYLQVEMQDRIRKLTEAIIPEVTRLQSEVKVIQMDRYWTDGAYRGIRFFASDNHDILLTMEMPEITFHTAGDTEISGRMFIKNASDSEFGCYVIHSPGHTVSIDFTVSTWSVYTSDSENAVSYTLSDGSEWGFCTERAVDGKPRRVYGSRVLKQDEKKTVYLTLRAGTASDRTYWPDMDTFISDMEAVLKNITISANEGFARNPAEDAGQAVTGWQEAGGKWYWYGADGKTATGWQEIDGKWYWFNAEGVMATGWQEVDGKQEQFTEDGVWVKQDQAAPAQNAAAAEAPAETAAPTPVPAETPAPATAAGWKQVGPDWYYYDENGQTATGWKQIGDSWYYLDENGKMTIGWIGIGEAWYYTDAEGRMVTGWQTIDGTMYYFGSDGKMMPGEAPVTDAAPTEAPAETATPAPAPTATPAPTVSTTAGWNQIGEDWYYYDENGQMATGWKLVGDGWFYLDESGKMTIGWIRIGEDWYYTDAEGRMVTGWKMIDGALYYFHGNGKMQPMKGKFTTPGNRTNPYFYFRGNLAAKMEFAPADATDSKKAALLAVMLMADYAVAQDSETDVGKLFDPVILSDPSLIGTDGSCVNLMMLSIETKESLHIYYDTRTNEAYCFYNKEADLESAVANFSTLCQDGISQIAQDAVYDVYLSMLHQAE